MNICDLSLGSKGWKRPRPYYEAVTEDAQKQEMSHKPVPPCITMKGLQKTTFPARCSWLQHWSLSFRRMVKWILKVLSRPLTSQEFICLACLTVIFENYNWKREDSWPGSGYPGKLTCILLSALPLIRPLKPTTHWVDPNALDYLKHQPGFGFQGLEFTSSSLQ